MAARGVPRTAVLMGAGRASAGAAFAASRKDGTVMRKSRRAARTTPQEGERGKTEKVVSKIAQVLEVPENSILNTCQMELLSNREAVVEGCQGVLEYDDTTVRLNMGNMIVRFLGRNLQIKGMTADSLVVEGFITSIEYMV